MTLETIPLLRHLNRAELQALRVIAQERSFAAGQEIFREGVPGDGVYFVKSGLVEISGGAGERKVFSRLGSGEILVEIKDTGSSIAPEIADKLFQPFATHGTGLGLTICKKIIEDHGGKISARNEPGHGAIFCFTLPLSN